ncbi:MAG TPA: enoyl-CoA hydratase-related protein, partial [Smithella sp.]|nr:enoyl-CoA hydratase-related protein [Smithella sp.]
MTINIKKEDHIMLIELDRPQKYNAMTREMYTQMARAYYQLDRDDDLWVGIVYANGPHFTSGLELTDWS